MSKNKAFEICNCIQTAITPFTKNEKNCWSIDGVLPLLDPPLFCLIKDDSKSFFKKFYFYATFIYWAFRNTILALQKDQTSFKVIWYLNKTVLIYAWNQAGLFTKNINKGEHAYLVSCFYPDQARIYGLFWEREPLSITSTCAEKLVVFWWSFELYLRWDKINNKHWR